MCRYLDLCLPCSPNSPSCSQPLTELAANPTGHLQYFKSIEKVATSQGFEQILPSSIRTGPNVKSFKPISAQPVPTTVIDEVSPPMSPKESSPTILSPQPTTSRLLRATSPANEYPVRSVSPDFDLVPDRMADRLPDPGFANMRLTPNPETQNARQVGVY